MKNINNNAFIKCLVEYNKYFMKKQILIFVITLVIFIIAFSIGMSTIDFKAPLLNDVNTLANIDALAFGHVFAIILTLLLALIPFVKKLSIITVFYAYYMAFNVSNMFYMQAVNKTFLALSVVLGLLALSLDIVFSLELSNIVNEKFNKILNKSIKENKAEKYNKNILIVIFVIFMILSIFNLIVIKFI